MNRKRIAPQPQGLEKMPTGIDGFDEITGGGLPRNRTSLVIGGPGAGKTVFAMQTLVNGARRWNEPGIFVAFEENSRQIIANAASFGWDLETMEKEGRLFILDAHLSADDIKSGMFDLVGMLASIKAKSDEMGAKRIVFDSIDVLLTFLNDPVTERQEIYRLHEWLAQEGPTGIITIRLAGDNLLLSQHYGFIQFMADCVILLRHYLIERVSLRDLRVVKYRGSKFEENEFPLIIDSKGIDVTSFRSKETKGKVSNERVSSGIERLDTMLNGGFFRGSSVLITGAPGTAKSTLCAAFAEAACRRAEKTIYISFDESADELVRNMSSVNIHLAPHIESGVLYIYSENTESRSSEEHLMRIKKLISEQEPRCLVIDPLSVMIRAGGRISALGVAKELLGLTNANLITTVLSSLVEGGESMVETSGIAISTVTDTWLDLSFVAQGGERNRALSIIKSRGTRHSNQVRELILSDQGVTLTDVYTARGEVLMGSLRWARIRAEALEKELTRAEIERKRIDLELADAETLARMETLKRQLEAQRAELALLIAQQKVQEEAWSVGQKDLGEMRDADKEF
ncbi:MAG: circadian clock protein KaiC [Pelolinea sp.]|nr:circadian clock protein KaiC [Pelolinea sp.]